MICAYYFFSVMKRQKFETIFSNDTINCGSFGTLKLSIHFIVWKKQLGHSVKLLFLCSTEERNSYFLKKTKNFC